MLRAGLRAFVTEAEEGGGRRAKSVCSLFVLAALVGAGAWWADAVEAKVGISLAFALPTVNGPERSVVRASVPAAKCKDAAQASMTPCWRHVSRAKVYQLARS